VDGGSKWDILPWNLLDPPRYVRDRFSTAVSLPSFTSMRSYLAQGDTEYVNSVHSPPTNLQVFPSTAVFPTPPNRTTEASLAS